LVSKQFFFSANLEHRPMIFFLQKSTATKGLAAIEGHEKN
jgi:hypothetical protein